MLAKLSAAQLDVLRDVRKTGAGNKKQKAEKILAKKKISKDELKVIATDKNLSTVGNKGELIKRIWPDEA